MAIVQLARVNLDDFGVLPNTVNMLSRDNLATISAPGYLNANLYQTWGVTLSPGDIISCFYSYDQVTGVGVFALFDVSFSFNPVTLVNDLITITAQAGSEAYLLKSGGTMTGGIKLSGEPSINGDVSTLRSTFLQFTTVIASTPISPVSTNTVWIVPTSGWGLIDDTGLASNLYDPGFNFTIKNTSAGNVTFTPFGTETVDGVAGAYTIAAGQAVQFMAAGLPNASAWIVTSNYNIASSGNPLPTYSRQVPVNGFSITIGAGIQNLVLVPAGQLATGTVIMPAAPVDKQIVSVSAEAAGVTSLAVNANAGQTIGNAPTTIAAGQGFSYQYNLANTNWMPIYQPSAASGVTAAQVQNWGVNSGSDTGTPNAYVLALSPPSAALTNSLTVILIPGNDNTIGSPTLNLDGHGPKAITKVGSASLYNSDIQGGYPTLLTYLASVDNWILQTPSNLNAPIPTQLQVQNNAFNNATTTGGPVNYTTNTNPSLAGYVNGQEFHVNFNIANSTTAPFIDLGPGTRAIVNRGQLPLAVNDVVVGVPAVIIYSSANSNFELQNPQTNTQPTIQVFNSGSGTYTKPAGCTRIVVKLVGGSGGGEGSGTSLTGTAGGNGADTTFGTATATGGKGGGGVTLGVGGLGGGASGSSTSALNGGNGGGGGVSLLNIGGGMGGAAGGGYGAPTPYIGGNAQPGTNGNSYGAGGSGAGGSATLLSGAGGGGGGYNEWWVNNPAATYSYSVGAGGTAGAAGTAGQIGGVGAGGLIEVEEYYN